MQCSEGVRALADTSKDDAANLIFKKYGLMLDIKVSEAKLGPGLEKHPYIHPRDFIKYLFENGCASNAIGVDPDDAADQFKEFWSRYARLYPNHEIVQRLQRNDAPSTV